MKNSFLFLMNFVITHFVRINVGMEKFRYVLFKKKEQSKFRFRHLKFGTNSWDFRKINIIILIYY